MGAKQCRAEFRVENLTQKIVLAESVAVAGDSRSRRKGLLGTTELDNTCGLWIAPCEAVHTFGMHFAIDVIFLDRDFRVCKIRSAVAPGRIAVSFRAASALELVAGQAASAWTSVGDQLSFRRRDKRNLPSESMDVSVCHSC